MAFIEQSSYEDAPKRARELWDQQVADHGRMTNMKRTMAHSALTLETYMQWYPLKDAVAAHIGERATILFAHAISSETDCLICSTFFRRILTDWGENPDAPELTEEEQRLVDLGRAIVTNDNLVKAELILPFKEQYGPAFVVDLIGFAGQMVATNIFNNVLQVELDEYLYHYKKP